MSSGEYWVIAVPKGKKSSRDVLASQQKTLERYTEVVNKFDMPSLRVSAVDELMKLNDKIAKYDVFARSVLYRLIRSYQEYTEQPDVIPTVKDRQLHNYIPKFKWDRGRCPIGQKLPALSEDIYERFGTTNDRLKTMIEKYKKVKAALQTDKRKAEGNLMVRDLQAFVKPVDYLEGEYITTAMVVVPTAKQEQFEKQYWCLERTDEAKAMWRKEMLNKQKMLEDDDEDQAPDDIQMTSKDVQKLECVAPGTQALLHKESDFV
eukprot:UN30638